MEKQGDTSAGLDNEHSLPPHHPILQVISLRHRKLSNLSTAFHVISRTPVEYVFFW